MEELVGQVRLARRRLNLQGFLGRLPWCLGGWLMAAAIAIAVAKWIPSISPAWVWNVSWLGGAVVLGFGTAALWSWLARLDDLAAAVEVDHRFKLKERISSSLSLNEEQSQSEAGQALINDAQARVRRINVADQFQVKPNRRTLIPLVPIVLALVFIFVIDQAKPTVASTEPTPQQFRVQAKKENDALRKKMKERRKRTSEKGLAEAEKIFREIERELDELQKKGIKDPKQALVKLNSLADKIKKRQQELGGQKGLKEQLAKLKKFSDGPAEKLADAMKRGELKKALEQIDTLREKMRNKNLTKAEQGELADQLNKMKQQLAKAAEDFEKKKQDVQEQMKQAQAAGDQAKADRMQQKLNQMQQQAGNMDQLDKLAQQLGQCAKCAGDGNMQQAQQALDKLANKLGNMQQQLDELETLDQAMNDIQVCKDGMCQGGGQGEGMAQKQQQGGGQKGGQGDKPGQGQGLGQGQQQVAGLGQGKGKNGQGKNDKPGAAGGGEGKGRGAQPIEEGDTAFFDTQVRQKIGRGKAVVAGSADGENAKGRFRDQIKSAYENEGSGPADPLSGQRLPKGHRKFVEEYFDNLRDGKSE